MSAMTGTMWPCAPGQSERQDVHRPSLVVRRMGSKAGGSRGTNREDPDDFVALPFGSLARFGRFISMRGPSSQEEHEAMLGHFADKGAETRREQQALRSRLEEVFAETDPLDLLARASLVYLRHDPDTYREWKDDRSPAHIEYLALQALSMIQRASDGASDPVRSLELTFEAIELTRELFQAASTLIVAEAIAAKGDAPDDQITDARLRAQLESLGVRGSGYEEHLERVLHGCLDPFDDECKSILGFTASDALALTNATVDLVGERLEPRWEQAARGRAQVLRAIKRERRKRKDGSERFPEWVLQLSPTEAGMQAGWLATSWLLSDAWRLASVTARELAESCTLDEGTCSAFLEAFACPPDQFDPRLHSLPGGAHPVTERPMLNRGDRYLLAVPSSMFDAIRPRMEDLLHEDPAVWDRYVDSRADYLEAESVNLLAFAIPGARHWHAIGWRSASDESDLDGLVAADVVGLRLQCKAGRVTAPARRGAPGRMKEDIGKLIREASDQHQRLEAAMEERAATSLGFTSDQGVALANRLQIEVIVTLDDVTAWAAETHRLGRLGALRVSRRVPWVLSLLDLMVVVDILQGADLILYLLRRERLERTGRVGAHDELDWVGHFLSEGLYFDGFFEGDGAPSHFRLLSYTEPIDAWYSWRAGARTVEVPKPTLGTPPALRAMVQRLEHERPPGWTLAAIAMLNGNQESLDMWEAALRHVAERLPRPGWSNHTQLFGEQLGVTLYVDHRVDWPEIRAAVGDLVDSKIADSGIPNWVAIGEGSSGQLFVLARETDPALPMAEVFRQPESGQPPHHQPVR